MKPAAPSRILLMGAPDFLRPLEQTGYAVVNGEADPSVCQVVVVDGRIAGASAVASQLKSRLGEVFVPLLWVGSSEAGFAAGADVCLPGEASAVELMGQVAALVRIQQGYMRVSLGASEAVRLNQRLQDTYRQLDSDLELVRILHHGFLPVQLPHVGTTRFAVCYRPRSRVGGDFYDVIRVDEEHVAFYVADALGHGVSASSLLTIFLKKTVQPKEIVGRSYRMVPPPEVLERLNRELVALRLPEPPFVTMVYALVNCRDGHLSFSRAAHPPPIYLPAQGEPELWTASGPLLGAFEGEYTAEHKQLRPGDKVMVYTDGLGPLRPDGAGERSDALARAAAGHRDLPVEAFVDAVALELLEQTQQPDDFTLLALEFGG